MPRRQFAVFRNTVPMKKFPQSVLRCRSKPKLGPDEPPMQTRLPALSPLPLLRLPHPTLLGVNAMPFRLLRLSPRPLTLLRVRKSLLVLHTDYITSSCFVCWRPLEMEDLLLKLRHPLPDPVNARAVPHPIPFMAPWRIRERLYFYVPSPSKPTPGIPLLILAEGGQRQEGVVATPPALNC